MSWLLAYKASSFVLVTFSSRELPASFTLWNGTLAFVHFSIVISPYCSVRNSISFRSFTLEGKYLFRNSLKFFTCHMTSCCLHMFVIPFPPLCRFSSKSIGSQLHLVLMVLEVYMTMLVINLGGDSFATSCLQYCENVFL